jgi:diguanylate cyclase (GGDEF)-like protein
LESHISQPGTTHLRDRRRVLLPELGQIQQRVWYLWVPSVAITILLAVGIVVFVHPGIKWRSRALIPGVVSVLPQLSLGLLCLALLEAFYIIAKVREARELCEYILASSQEAGFPQADYPHDALTGTLDRRALPEVLQRESVWVDRYRIPLCLVVCDIRDFSQINEKEGHMAGDLVLKDFGRALQATVRQTDSVLRYGPDEFLCILPRTDSAGAAAFTRRVREACQRCGRLRNISIDFGIAVYEAGVDVNATLANAERNLTAQKSSTRHPDDPLAQPPLPPS